MVKTVTGDIKMSRIDSIIENKIVTRGTGRRRNKDGAATRRDSRTNKNND